MNRLLRAKATVYFVLMRFGFSIVLNFMGLVYVGKEGKILTIFISSFYSPMLMITGNSWNYPLRKYWHTHFRVRE